MCLIRRRFLLVFDLLLVAMLVSLLTYHLHHWGTTSSPNSFASLEDLQTVRSPPSPPSPPPRCTMGTCFNASRCRGGFKVYVYPRQQGGKVSGLYQRILEVIEESPYYTDDPLEACLLVPSVDTLDRDKLSDNYVKFLPSLASLPHWRGGENHLLFNQYSGTWPSYSGQLDFSTGKAIVAKASFSEEEYRPGFDVSLPLVHDGHPKHGGQASALQSLSNAFPLERRHLLVFRGKRYLYGIGSETRNALHHMHNGGDLVLVTSCRHNADWDKHNDGRCNTDNQLYDMYDYQELLTNSSFCLVPRGRRLGSFRLLEAVRASCIPVSLSNGYVLPFSEVVVWRSSALAVDERHLLDLPYLLRAVPSSHLLAARMQTKLLWDSYFKSVETVVMTTLKIIQNRLYPQAKFTWNSSPGGVAYEPSYSQHVGDFPFHQSITSLHSTGKYSAVILASETALRKSSPLYRLVKTIGQSPSLDKVVIVWTGRGAARIAVPELEVPVVVKENPLEEPLTSRLAWMSDIETDTVLQLSQDCSFSVDEAEFGFEVWKSFPDRLVGFVSHSHHWDYNAMKWVYSTSPSNNFSLLSSDAIFYHRYYSYLLPHHLATRALAVANDPACYDLALGFMVAKVTGAPPVKATHKTTISSPLSAQLKAQREACLNMLANAFGHVPLLYSWVRMDPLLF